MITPMHVDVDKLVGGGIGLVDERPDGHDAGVVDEHVERPQTALNGVEELGEAGFVGDVEAQADGPRSQLGGGPLDQRTVDVAERHPRALGDQRRRRRAPDPAAPARDRNHLAIQRSQCLCHFRSPPRGVARRR